MKTQLILNTEGYKLLNFDVVNTFAHQKFGLDDVPLHTVVKRLESGLIDWQSVYVSWGETLEEGTPFYPMSDHVGNSNIKNMEFMIERLQNAITLQNGEYHLKESHFEGWMLGVFPKWGHPFIHETIVAALDLWICNDVWDEYNDTFEGWDEIDDIRDELSYLSTEIESDVYYSDLEEWANEFKDYANAVLDEFGGLKMTAVEDLERVYAQGQYFHIGCICGELLQELIDMAEVF